MKAMWNSGLVSVSFRKASPEEICKAASAAGLTAIEWGSDVHAPFDASEKLQDIVRLQELYGIRCSSYGTYFRLGETPLSLLPSYIAAAERLGTRVLRLWCGDRAADAYTADEKEALFAICRAAAKTAEKMGVTLCMECHPNSFTETAAGAAELLAAVPSPAFRMYWQPNQYRSFEENMAYAKAVAPYTVNIHVFHWIGETRLPLADGLPQWKRYLQAFDKTQTLLLEFMPDDRIDTLPREAGTLRKLIGGKE